MTPENSLQKIVDDFRYSDSVPATAAKFILAALAAGPVIVSAAAFPGLFSELNRTSKKNKYSRDQFKRAYQNLKYKKLIQIVQEDNEKFEVQLTNSGIARVKTFYFKTLKIQKPKKWDKKWRIFIFDIPAKPKAYHQAREALRKKIKDLGFYQMQKSVWVYPYECEDEILFVAELFYVQKYIEILTVEKLLHEEKIKKIFNL
jgi:DNA-binding transcriptional regulator PaaX